MDPRQEARKPGSPCDGGLNRRRSAERVHERGTIQCEGPISRATTQLRRRQTDWPCAERAAMQATGSRLRLGSSMWSLLFIPIWAAHHDAHIIGDRPSLGSSIVPTIRILGFPRHGRNNRLTQAEPGRTVDRREGYQPAGCPRGRATARPGRQARNPPEWRGRPGDLLLPVACE